MFLLQASELSYIAPFRGFDLFLVGIIVLGVVFLKIFLPQYIEKKSEIALAEIAARKENLSEENNQLIKNICSRIDRLEEIVINSQTEMQNHDNEIHSQIQRLVTDMQSQSTIIKNTSKQTLKGLIYNEHIQTLERLFAFKNYIALGGNGNCKEYALASLIIPNKKLWQSVIDDEDEVAVPKTAIYEKTLLDIKIALKSA